MSRLGLAWVAVWLSGGAVPGLACSCMGPSVPCEAVWTAAAVFSGTVLEIVEPAPPEVRRDPGGPAVRSARRSATDPPLPWPKRTVRLHVGEALTGVPADQKEVEVLTGMGGSDCGYRFQVGEDYVVYAYRDNEGRLGTGICSRTRPLAEAAEDLAYFHAVRNAPDTADVRIFAMTDGAAGLAGVKATLSGGGQQRTVTTDASGQASFEGLPPGEYRVSSRLEGYTPFDRPVTLQAKGCGQVMLYMRFDRRISGRVLTAEGQPAAGIEVQVQAVQGTGSDTAKTDADGRFELNHLDKGGYYVGVNLLQGPSFERPYARWFYPGTEDRQAAAAFYFEQAPKTYECNLTLPAPQGERFIEGVVVWPDGRPAAGARLVVMNPNFPVYAPVAQANADVSGSFRVRVLDATDYRLHAVSNEPPLYRPRSAEPVEIPAGKEAQRVRLTVTRQGDSVNEEMRSAIEQLRKTQ